MKVNGSKMLMSGMEGVFRFGLMDQDMKDIGRIIVQMEKEG